MSSDLHWTCSWKRVVWYSPVSEKPPGYTPVRCRTGTQNVGLVPSELPSESGQNACPLRSSPASAMKLWIPHAHVTMQTLVRSKVKKLQQPEFTSGASLFQSWILARNKAKTEENQAGQPLVGWIAKEPAGPHGFTSAGRFPCLGWTGLEFRRWRRNSWLVIGEEKKPPAGKEEGAEEWLCFGERKQSTKERQTERSRAVRSRRSWGGCRRRKRRSGSEARWLPEKEEMKRFGGEMVAGEGREGVVRRWGDGRRRKRRSGSEVRYQDKQVISEMNVTASML